METVTVAQLVRADRATVRRAFLDAGELARWWWPHLPDVTYAVDPQAEGAYRIRCEAAGIGVHGQILTLGDGAAVISWIWEDGVSDGPAETVTIQFTDPGDGEGTLVTVTHPCTDADNLRRGWIDALTRLAALY